MEASFYFYGGSVYMWIFLLIVIIGLGTIIGFLKEQSKQNKKIIEILEDINKNK